MFDAMKFSIRYYGILSRYINATYITHITNVKTVIGLVSSCGQNITLDTIAYSIS